MASVAKHIRRLRTERHMTQGDLAEKLFVTRQTVSAWETGKAQPDLETFRCLALAIRAAKEGGTAPAILNGANEVAVARFLAGEIGFLDIARVVEHALDTVPRAPLTLEAVYAADRAARAAAEEACR